MVFYLFDYPLLLSWWSVTVSLFGLSLLYSFLEERRSLGRRLSLWLSYTIGVLSAVAGSALSWIGTTDGWSAVTITTSFILLGYCSTEIRRAGSTDQEEN